MMYNGQFWKLSEDGGQTAASPFPCQTDIKNQEKSNAFLPSSGPLSATLRQ